MKKKKLLLPALIVSSIFANVQTTQAMTIDENGDRWWTIGELLEMIPEAKAEREEKCGEDFSCQMEVREEQLLRDSKYQAINSLEGARLKITGINIAKNEVTVFVDKEDEMRKRMNLPNVPNVPGEVEVMELAWEEGDYSNHADMANFHSHIWYGKDIEGLHTLYTFDGADNFLDKKETILKIKDADLSENTTNIIKFFMKDSNGGTIMGSVDYGECVNSTNYVSGMDCKMAISEKPVVRFLPFEVEVEGKGETETSELDDDILEEEIIEVLETDENVPLAPNTGLFISEETSSDDKNSYLYAVIFSFFAIFCVFYYKNQKKSKKVLDIIK